MESDLRGARVAGGMVFRSDTDIAAVACLLRTVDDRISDGMEEAGHGGNGKWKLMRTCLESGSFFRPLQSPQAEGQALR